MKVLEKNNELKTLNKKSLNKRKKKTFETAIA